MRHHLMPLQRLLAGSAGLAFACALWSAPPASRDQANSPSQDGNGLNVPLLGFAVSGATELRAITGVPGASLFSDPLPLPDGAASLRLGPGHRFGLLQYADGSASAIVRLENGVVAGTVPVDGLMGQADTVAFSRSGSGAALYSSTAGRLQVVIGLPNAPRLVRDLGSDGLPGAVNALSVSDDGRMLALSTADNALFLLPQDGNAVLALTLRGAAALAFFPDGATVAVADRATGSIYLAALEEGSVKMRLLGSGLDGPSVLRVDDDGASVLAGSSQARSVWSLDVTSGDVRAFEAPTAPTSFEPMRNRGTYLISAEPGQPAWLMVREGDSLRMPFVPAVVKAE